MPGSSHYTGTWSPSPGSPWVGALGIPACSRGMKVRSGDQTCIARSKAGPLSALHSTVPPAMTTLSGPGGERLGKQEEGLFWVPTSFSSCSTHSQNTDITHTYTHGFRLIPSYRSPGSGSPEERVVLDADLPQSLGRPVVWELKANRALKLLILQDQVGQVRSKTWAHSTAHPSFLPS